jgi:hypothetical protein
MRLLRPALVLCPLPFALCALLPAQGAPRYTAELLRCVAFEEEVRTTVDARRGMQGWQERGARRGLLQLRARPDPQGLAFEAWYDSLKVEYTRPDSRLTPDTDGLIGGRWTGTMFPHGQAALAERPFVPPDLAQVSDLSDALLDFFPPLATAALTQRARWTDSLGLDVERLKDSTAGDEQLQRYRWHIVSHGGETPAVADTSVRIKQEIEDEGTIVWSVARGPLAWRREIQVTTRVSAGRRGGTPSEGRVTQAIIVRRITNPADCA